MHVHIEQVGLGAPDLHALWCTKVTILMWYLLECGSQYYLT